MFYLIAKDSNRKPYILVPDFLTYSVSPVDVFRAYWDKVASDGLILSILYLQLKINQNLCSI